MNTMKKCSTCGQLFAGDLCPKCMAGFAQNPTNPTLPPEDLPLKTGQTFHGMEILELLGRGGMGVVFKARQPALDRLVALKILPQKLALDPDFQNRFIREAKALGSLSHPNIVAVYDFGAEGGLFFFAMEFVDGTNLRQILRDRKFSPEQALKLVPQLCDALEYAHEEGVVHRDIKPENILLDKKGRVKIADFGLAKLTGADVAAAGALTMTNMVMGTPHYMAPEQIENPKSVDHRADIYSIGVVFYEMLTGELPIGRFEVPSKKVQIDVRLDEVVLKALEKAPDRRYQKASDVKDAVTRATSIGTTDAYQPTVITPAPAKKGPNRPLIAMAGVTAVAVILALVALFNRPAPTVAPPPPVVEAAGPVDLTPLHFTSEEKPLGHKFLLGDKERPKMLPRNPYPAKEPAELERIAQYLAEFGLQNVSPSDLKQAYVSVWWGSSFFALESPIADRLEREVTALKDPTNRWAHRKGNQLVIVFAGGPEARDYFVELVGMAQKKLGLPVEPPDLPVAQVLYTQEELSSDWEIVRQEPGVQELALKADPQKPAIRIECRQLNTPANAKAAEAALKKDGTRRVEGFSSGRTLTVIRQLSGDVHSYEKMAGPLRQRMGFPSHTFETILPISGEMPEGYAIESTRTDAAAIMTDLGLDLKPADAKRAWQARLKPHGMITLFEVSDYSTRNKFEEQLRKRGPAEDAHDCVFAVEGPDDETLDALENRMREKFGWDRRQPRAILIARMTLQPADLPKGWTIENAVSDKRLYTADLKGPQATLKLTCQESHNYGEISTFKKALPYRPGDILLFNYAVIAHVGGSSEALWPVLDQIEALLRKKMRMAAAKLEDLPLSFGSGTEATVLWEKVLRERVELKKLADLYGIDVSRIKGALVARQDAGRAILELEGEGEAVPKADRLIRRGRFVACFDAKAPEATVEAVRAQLRAPRP
ncbi:MAG TPA: protein kinase [Planctomycetota bacterium]|nr:protein kinase [Planctomycetota bacterium]